ncbi:GAF domain-containing protein [Roseobacter sp. YSTF-M11]|uniref:GAF domain-containing protein n=1 Tax=Roseobacter insulae TaxID=2859783 RepID=A0A9X1FV11_9RHOB|nr:GAF domain-containing protein [Roseobacter insulae]MBW4708157.1 GAF domain-containing protein [Roseobacter insulae]
MEKDNGIYSLDALAEWLNGEIGDCSVLITQTQADRQLNLASSGVPLPKALRLEMPIRYSICQHVKAMDFPLVVDNALTHPLLRDNDAVTELGIAAYAGAPTHYGNLQPFGAVCVLKRSIHRWQASEISLILRAASFADRVFASTGNHSPRS